MLLTHFRTFTNCFKLQAIKQSSKQQVPVPKAQDLVAVIHGLVKVPNNNLALMSFIFLHFASLCYVVLILCELFIVF